MNPVRPVSIVVLVLLADATLGCGGNKLRIEYIRNCNSDNVIELSDNFTVVMKDNCDVHIGGCVTSHADITSVVIDYTFQKDTFKRSGKKDGCNQLKNKVNEAERALDMFGLPKRCPINKGTWCLENKSISLSKYKLQMHIVVGNLKGKVLITTDAGKSCMEFSAKLDNAIAKTLPTIGRGVLG